MKRKVCDICSFPTCIMTTDIEHAVNFEKINGRDDMYFEKHKTIYKKLDEMEEMENAQSR